MKQLGKKGTVPICRNGPKGALHKWGLSPFFPKHLRNTAILVGLALYVAAFYATSLPSLQSNPGESFRRFQLLLVLLFQPDEWLWQNWFGVPAQFSVVDRLFVLLGAGAIVAWAAAVGWLLLTVCRMTRSLTRLETALFSTAVGLNAVGTWTLLMGLFGQLDRLRTFWIPAAATFAAVVCVCCCRLHLWNRHSNICDGENGNSRGPTARGAATKTFNIVGRRWLWWGLPFVGAILLTAMLPPLDFDVCEYHLQAPKEFFQQGKIAFLPHNVYANMALGTEMLSLLAMTLVGDWWWGALVGKTVIAVFTPLCALAIYAAGRRFHSNGAGVVGALVYISIPWIVSVSSAGLVEGASACYLFLALYALLLLSDSCSCRVGQACAVPPSVSSESSVGLRKLVPPYVQGLIGPETALILLSGYLAGGAVATKYPAVLFVLLPLAFWLFFSRLVRRGDSSVALSECPANNGVPNSRGLTAPGGNPRKSSTLRGPLAPGYCESSLPKINKRSFNHAVFSLTVFLLSAAIGCGLWFGKNWALTGNPTYPLLYGVFGGETWNPDKERQWNAVHRPHDFSPKTLGKNLGAVVLTSEWLSPVVVPLALLAFVGGGVLPSVLQKLRWKLLAYFVFIVAVWWLFTHRIDRFWIPALPVLALLAGAGACWTAELWWRRLLKTMLAAALVANLLVVSAGPTNAWFIPLEQLRFDTNWITPWHWFFNNDYNNSSRRGCVLAVGDAAVFDLKPPVLYNTCFDDCIFERLVKDKTPQEIRKEFAARKIAYVFVNWSEIERYRDTYGFTDFVRPAVFDRLVEQGVLEPLPVDPKLSQCAYRVVP